MAQSFKRNACMKSGPVVIIGLTFFNNLSISSVINEGRVNSGILEFFAYLSTRLYCVELTKS